jgi:O-antigen ligase
MLGAIGVSAAWSAYPFKVATNIVHMAGVIAIALAAAYRYRDDMRTGIRHIAYAFGVCVLIHAAAAVALPAYAVDNDGRWAGLSGNANTLGVIAWSALWANVVASKWSVRHSRKMIHLALSVVAAVSVALSGSRTSMACAVVAVGGFWFLAAMRQASKVRLGHIVVLALIAAVVVVLMLASFGIGWGDLASASGRSSDFSGRIPIWMQALELIKERPLLGWGFDDNSTVIEITGLPHMTFHNGFLDAMVRGGALSLVIVLAIVRRGFRDLRINAADGSSPHAMVAFYPFLIALILENLTEASFLAARNASWILVLFIAYSAALQRVQTRRMRLQAQMAKAAA